MTFDNIWIQVQTKWEQYHHGERSLLAKVKCLESILLANNLDPNVDVDGNVDDVDQDSDSGVRNRICIDIR